MDLRCRKIDSQKVFDRRTVKFLRQTFFAMSSLSNGNFVQEHGLNWNTRSQRNDYQYGIALPLR